MIAREYGDLYHIGETKFYEMFGNVYLHSSVIEECILGVGNKTTI